MQQDSGDDIQNSNLVSDDLTSHLASVGATQQPGQQFTPDPTAIHQPATTAIGSDLPDPTPKPQPPVAPQTFTPPIPEEPVVPEKDQDQVVKALDELTIAPTESTPATEEISYKVEPEDIPEPTPIGPPTEEAEEPKELDELDEIKVKALGELKPLVSKLDLTPEKRYDLLMEIIQASNDESLLPEAFETAEKIDDDDLRAQALMEVVNEIEFLKSKKAA